MSFRRFFAACFIPGVLFAGVLFAMAPQAFAHGRFPQAGTIAVDPNDAERIFVRTTYGATVTTDGGETWAWVCPEAMGFNADKEDPSPVITADGSIVLGTFGGLSVSHDETCAFGYPSADVEGRFFVDVQTEPGEQAAIAVSSNGIDSFAFDVNLWETADAGTSWAHLGTSPPADFLALSLGIAPSDNTRLYLTGRDGLSDAELAGVVFRSDDRGGMWQRFEVPGTTDAAEGEQILPYMGGVDPANPDRLYVGVITTLQAVVTHFELLVSDDGAASWTSVFVADGEVSGFALSPDGQTVAIGGPKQGLLTAAADTLAFSQVNEVRVRCLTWVESGMYACTDQFVDGYSLGRSTDAGATFEPLAELGSPCGPPECGAETRTGQECPGRWPQEQAELNAYECGGGGGGGGGASGSGAEPEDSSGSCGCRIYAAPASSAGQSQSARPVRDAAALVALVALTAVALRRRRR